MAGRGERGWKLAICWSLIYLSGCTCGVFLLPSVLFWGSGVLKESLLLFALGTFLLYSMRATRGTIGFPAAALMLFSLALMFFLKIYVIASLLPGLVAYVW